MEKIFVLGIGVSNVTTYEALEFIVKGLEEKAKKLVVFTPNPEIIMFAQKGKRFKMILNSADLALPDGVGVMWAAKMLGKQLAERITGVDFMEMLCEKAAKRGFTIGLIGGGPKIAERAAECLRLRYPGLKIVFVSQEWSEDRFNIDILFVAFGFPKQERWIHDHLYSIPVRVAMAVGGSFDYLSGRVPRAPQIVRDIGLEWLFRLITQPWRLRRQLALLSFIYSICIAKFGKKKKS